MLVEEQKIVNKKNNDREVSVGQFSRKDYSNLVSHKILNKNFYGVDFEEKILSVRRVNKSVSGGSVYSFSILVVIGNKNGCFGIGLGKSFEIIDARKKAINNAKKDLSQIILTKQKTIPHVVEAKYGSVRIVIRPARKGRGVIAGGATRSILECVGIKDVVAKCIGSSNKQNLAYATKKALLTLKSNKYYAILKNSNKKLDFNISTSMEKDDDRLNTDFDNSETVE